MVFKIVRNTALVVFLLFLFIVGAPAMKVATGMGLFFWAVGVVCKRKFRGR